MTERFIVKSQDDYFGVVDNYSADKVCVVNGIRTEIEANWLVDLLNELSDENEQLKSEINDLKFEKEKWYRQSRQLEQMLKDVER